MCFSLGQIDCIRCQSRGGLKLPLSRISQARVGRFDTSDASAFLPARLLAMTAIESRVFVRSLRSNLQVEASR